MLGNCIIAVVFSPILAEFLAFFNHDCRGFIRSDKIMKFGSINIEPRTFRAIVFFLIFVVLFPILRWLCDSGLSWRSDLGFVVSYMCFMALIEPLIIYLNKDEEAKTTPKEPFPDWFSLKTRWALFALIVFIAACAHPMIWSACFKKPLEKNPAAYAEIVKKIPKEMRRQALWFLLN